MQAMVVGVVIAVTLAAGGASAAPFDPIERAPWQPYTDEAALLGALEKAETSEGDYFIPGTGVDFSLPGFYDAFAITFEFSEPAFGEPENGVGSDVITFAFFNSETGRYWLEEPLLSADTTFYGVAGSPGGETFDGLSIFIGSLNYSLDVTRTTYGTALPVAPSPVPLPASVALLGAALAGLGLMRRRSV